MINLPDTRFNIDDAERLADWVELSLLASERDVLSTADVADVVHDSLLIDDEESESQQQAATDRVDTVLRVIRQRRRYLGDGYPFVVKHDVVVRQGEWHHNLCFTMLLLSDIGRFYRNVNTDFDPASPFTRLFEKIVRASLERIFGGTAVRFGVPREEEWPSGIVERVERLATEFGLRPDHAAEKTEPHDGDIGLDVAVRFRFGEEGAGSGVLLTQCATGENWQGKKGEPSLLEWSRLIEWHSPLFRALAFPWRRDIDDRRFGRLSVRFEAIFFDRMRLLSGGNPDATLTQAEAERIRGWCAARMSEFPPVKLP